MDKAETLEQIVIAAHALTRVAALETNNDAPAAQWRALSILRAEGAQRVGDLAVASRTTQPGMTRLVGQMADQGLVDRSPDPTDSRAIEVSVTPAGLAALDAWLAQLRQALEPRFADLDDREWAVLQRAAAILAAHTAPRVAGVR